jgi:dihydrofolate reductase
MEGNTTFHFVTEGIEAALERARAAAAGLDVAIGGGASVVQQYLHAGLLDELELHVAPVLLGDGVRMFAAGEGGTAGRLEIARVVTSSAATHLRYRRVS